MKKITGFNLIEILIVLAMIAILSTTSFSVYSNHLIKERRLEAEATLSKLAVSIEQFFLSHNTFTGASLESLGFNDKIADNHYHLVIALATPNEFRIEAKPSQEQAAKDTTCGTLILNSLGERSMTGTGKLSDCW